MKNFRYFLEYLAFIIITSVLRMLSVDKSADFCAAVMRKLGPYLKVTRIARKNLRMIYGDKDIAKEDKIIDGLLDNFGRFIGEFPHLHSLEEGELRSRVQIIGLENIKHLQDSQQPFLLFSGHLANWEVASYILNVFYPKVATIYRKANNPFVDTVIKKWRYMDWMTLVAKGPSGAQGIIRSIKEKRSIAMLVDQKMNDGISVQFFGRPAMTAPAIAKFALQFNYPIIPLQIIRTSGSHFKIILSPALNIPITSNKDDAVLMIMQNINDILEGWIRENPSQWFWFHNRWS
jgi:KDO2-lipid IV(A) lauroyltransferase